MAGKSVQDELVQRLWGAVDATILPEECNIYSYHSETDGDPLSGEGKIWAFNYFFCNKKLKRILYITAESLDDEDLGLHSDEEVCARPLPPFLPSSLPPDRPPPPPWAVG